MTDDERIAKWLIEWHGVRHEPLMVTRLRTVLLAEQIVKVLEVMADVCPHCWDAERPCYCTNDD